MLFVNYSISPEVKFPVAANECFSVFNWVLNAENAKNIAVDPSRVVVAGDSAGGNLTVALTRNYTYYCFIYLPILFFSAS